MNYRLPRGLCTIHRNDSPARFTGNYFRWIAETPQGKTYCDTRESARVVVYRYRAERYRLLRQGDKAQAAMAFQD